MALRLACTEAVLTQQCADVSKLIPDSDLLDSFDSHLRFVVSASLLGFARPLLEADDPPRRCNVAWAFALLSPCLHFCRQRHMLVVEEFCASTGAQEQTVLAAYDADAPLNLSPPRLRQGWGIMPEDGDGDE